MALAGRVIHLAKGEGFKGHAPQKQRYFTLGEYERSIFGGMTEKEFKETTDKMKGPKKKKNHGTGQILISPQPESFLSPLKVRRFHSRKAVPGGWGKIKTWRGESIYDEDGNLKSCYWNVKRF